MANELLSYRETVARALQMLRPAAEVRTVEPGQLDAEVVRFAPDLVVCDRASSLVKSKVRAWVELYLDGGPQSVVCLGGRRSEVGGMDLEDLLGLIDRVEAMKRADETGSPASGTRTTG